MCISTVVLTGLSSGRILQWETQASAKHAIPAFPRSVYSMSTIANLANSMIFNVPSHTLSLFMSPVLDLLHVPAQDLSWMCSSLAQLAPCCQIARTSFPCFVLQPAEWRHFAVQLGASRETQRKVPPRCEKRTSPVTKFFLGKRKCKRPLPSASQIARFQDLSIIEGDSSENTIMLSKALYEYLLVRETIWTINCRSLHIKS